MKYLALAMLLTVMQTAPPVPRQATDSSAGASDSVQHQANSEQETSAKPSPSGQSQSHDAPGNEQGTNNAEHSISISKLPPVTVASPKRDWADWGIWVFTLLLAATSVLQIWLLRRTLRYVRRQAHEMRHQRHEIWRQRKAMEGQVTEMGSQTEVLKASVASAEKSADAAKISADIAVGVSIPTLVIHEFGIGDVEVANNEAFFQYPTFKITVKNYGQTPAFLKYWSLKIECGLLPNIPEYGDEAIPLEKVVVQPNETYTLPEIGFPRRISLPLEDAKAIVERTTIFNVYGYICYGDLFGNPTRRLKFCETLLNIFGPQNFDWCGELAPAAYRGTDQRPSTKAQHQPEKAN